MEAPPGCLCRVLRPPVVKGVSNLAKRLIGESSDRETRTYNITADPEHLDELERFFSWINITRSGHSGSAQLYVDGDGRARVEISRKGAALKKPEEEIHSTSGGGPEYKVGLESLSENENTLDEIKLVIESTKPQKIHICPHCSQEIFEKHTFMEGDFMSGHYIERHSDCKGAQCSGRRRRWTRFLTGSGLELNRPVSNMPPFSPPVVKAWLSQTLN